MSNPVSLTHQDLAVIFNLLGSASINVANITNVLPSLQRLEAAVRAGEALVAASFAVPAPAANDDGPVSPGGTE